MSNTDSIRSLDPETSAQVMEVVNDLDLHLDAENKAASAVFGGARKRSLKEPSRRDSPTLPWRNPLRLSASGSGVATPQARSPSPPKRSESPDIGTILARTPRPRKTSTATPSSSKKRLSHTSPKSEHLQSLMSDYADFMEDDSDGEGGSESDSSIDIHTPLPHLMFRDGLLSPRSKLLPQSTTPFSMYSLQEEDNADPSGSVLSFASTAGSVTTKSGLQRDPRDTQRRRQRHRDGRLLKAGMGLTTGLGWSDSEDEDAPSALTRRLIHTTLERKRSGSVTSGTRPSSMHESVSRLASPGPPSSPPLSRKLHSFSNLRSASMSYSSNTPSPLSPGFGPGSGPRVPRGRAVSTTTPPIARTVSSPLKPATTTSPALSPRMRSDSDANPSLLREKLVTSPVPISQLPTAPKSPSTRKRAESSASTASVATTSTSLASISIESLRSAATPTASTDSLPSSNTHPMRKRTESSASNSTTTTSVSAGSSYSQNSSSTSVPSSASSGYRPLHLPRAAGLTGPKPAPVPPRSRTQSHSALPLPSSFVRRTTSGSTFSGVLPAGAPPTLRQRPVPAGARSQPQPRTGTGMVYRTSSYTSLHEAGSRMRSASVVASQS